MYGFAASCVPAANSQPDESGGAAAAAGVLHIARLGGGPAMYLSTHSSVRRPDSLSAPAS